IANVFAEEFIAAFEEGQDHEDGMIRWNEGEERLLINQDGYYISHPNNEKEWGFELDHDHKLEKDFSAEIVKQILGTQEGIIEHQGDFLSYHRVDYSPEQPEYLIVIDKIPEISVFASVNSFKIAASLIIIISLATVLPMGIFRGRQLTNLIEQLVNSIFTSSQQTFSTMTQQERVASQQAASVSETTTTMDELEASCRQSAEQAQAAVSAAKQALELSEDGGKAVEENLEGMSSLEQKVEAIAQQIVNLSEQAHQIGGISQVVSDLANQTNMLALNSSVEAARAGEHGKGFAVVANEIRKLSDQSQRSADKISTIVSDIQKSINSTVMVSEEGTKTAKMGLEIAHKTEQAFFGVKDAVNKVVLNNQQISLNLKQQVDGIQQIVEAMDVINQGAKETASGIGQTREGTEKLNQIALELKRMV
ncbi:MAG: methyl-accepting chemotaxis protein, partial [Merismopedia sp. SIO2A8]|nr:methyl-accepting chemotaxis protein [Merismopedia sp. SIO2A8]